MIHVVILSLEPRRKNDNKAAARYVNICIFIAKFVRQNKTISHDYYLLNIIRTNN